MDPITQGAMGAVAAQAFYPKARKLMQESKASFWPATFIAALAAMSPDLDVLIRSDNDPLLFLVFHRQFTHSLIFIPFGALICTLVLYPLFARKRLFTFNETYVLSLMGYATHALLDACTTYGTMLYWPFSDYRVAWHNIAVVDLFFTLPVLLLLFMGAKFHTSWLARIAIVWIFFYLYLGLLQKERAENIAEALWSSDEPLLSLNAKPTMSNLWVWKIVYETETRFYIDAVHIGIFDKDREAIIYRGHGVDKLVVERDFPWLDKDSQQAQDILRFAWFSMDYVAKDTDHPHRIIDIRYSIVPNSMQALWAIELDPEAGKTQHVKYHSERDTGTESRKTIMRILRGLPLED